MARQANIVIPRFGVTGGTGNTYTLTIGPDYTGYEEGDFFIVKPDRNNTGAATLNINSLGAISIRDIAGAELEADSIVNNRAMWLYFDGTYCRVVFSGSELDTGGVIYYTHKIGSDSDDGVTRKRYSLTSGQFLASGKNLLVFVNGIYQFVDPGDSSGDWVVIATDTIEFTASLAVSDNLDMYVYDSGVSSGGSLSLDDCYDDGGPGGGRTINVSDGPVKLILPDEEFLELTDTVDTVKWSAGTDDISSTAKDLNLGSMYVNIDTGKYYKKELSGLNTRFLQFDEILTYDRTYYIDGSSGSDVTGDGSSGSPWATGQHAIDNIPKHIAEGVTETVKFISGSYSESLVIEKFRGRGTLHLEADQYENGEIATGGSTTTIVDSTKSWDTDIWLYAWITAYPGGNTDCRGRYQNVSGNSSTSVTLSSANPVATASGNRYSLVNTSLGTGTDSTALHIRYNDVDIKISGFRLNNNDTGNCIYTFFNTGLITINSCLVSNFERSYVISSSPNSVILNNCYSFSAVTTHYYALQNGTLYLNNCSARGGADTTIYTSYGGFAISENYVSSSVGSVSVYANAASHIRLTGTSSLERPTGGYGIYCALNSVVTYNPVPTWTGTGTSTAVASGGQIASL